LPRLWGAVRRGASAFHRFSVRHGMTVGTGLIVGGVTTSVGLYEAGYDMPAAFMGVVPPTIGSRMNFFALGTRLENSYRTAQGGRFRKLAIMVRDQSDATGVKLWSYGLRLMGLGQVVAHTGNQKLLVFGHATTAVGAALTAAGVGLHTVPRVVRAARKRWRGQRAP
jgi:hypothetical protein